MQWDGNCFVLMQQGDFAHSSKGAQNLARYELTKIPCRLLITTAEKKQFDVTVLSVTDDGGIDLEYHLTATEAPAGPAATVTDHERLHGVWKVLSVKKNSHALPEIDGQYVFQSGRFKIFDDGKEAVFGTYAIDPSPNPKTIDLHDVSKLKRPTLLAIYEFPSEGRLRISYGDNKTGRPTSFDAKRGIGNFAVLELRLQTKDASAMPKSSDRKPLTPVKPDESSDESNKKTHLPNAAGDPGT
jgi:uncharacterized protein (TIGR03067 family)